MREQTTFDRFLSRYESGELPWDDDLPPPEVLALVKTLPPGRALDLGCGHGRAAIHLASQGWQADGVDFVPLAIEEAKKRAAAAQVAKQTRFFVGSVAKLHFLDAAYDLAIDVGCFHALTAKQRQEYANEQARLLKKGASFLLFAHLKDEGDIEGHGIEETAVFNQFSTLFTLQKVEHGYTKVENKPTFTSAWFWYQRS